MGHSNIRIKVRRRKVAQLAAHSRQFTVRNISNGISEKIEHKLHYNGTLKDAITNPFTGHKFVPTNPHPIPGNYGISITGYDWVEPEGMLWIIPDQGFKQPKRLIKCKARKYGNWKSYTPQDESVKKIKREKHNDFLKFFPNFPYTIKPMSKEAYWEKLVAHKLQKWEKSNPKPEQDLFEKVENWEQKRFVAEQRFRDFVVSCYNKLELNGRFKQTEQKFIEEKVAEIKDVNMEGHHVNELNKDSKLLKKAQKITDETKKKKPNLIATNLKDHKKQKGRIILPQAA